MRNERFISIYSYGYIWYSVYNIFNNVKKYPPRGANRR